MAWRADVRTPRILATALERLADSAKNPAKNDPEVNIISGSKEEGTETRTHPSRQEILESGEEVGITRF